MSTFGRFDVQALIGEGDIAKVYRAVDQQTGQLIALKVLREDSPEANAPIYFQNEIHILSQLNHPHIPAFYGASQGAPAYIALELIEGKDGEELLAELPEGAFFPSDNLIRWGAQICDALAYLYHHEPPIAFRDMKASHLMVDLHENAWLVDFNLARVMPPERYIEAADLVGTEGFAAPEQYSGVVSPLADIYTLGATLHYLATRIDPRKERRFAFAPPRSINHQLSKQLAGVIMKGLAYEPEDRWQSAQDFKTALLACR